MTTSQCINELPSAVRAPPRTSSASRYFRVSLPCSSLLFDESTIMPSRLWWGPKSCTLGGGDVGAAVRPYKAELAMPGVVHMRPETAPSRLTTSGRWGRCRRSRRTATVD